MALGYIFIKADPKMVVPTFRALKATPEIIEIHPLFGEHDLIVKMEAKDFKTLSKFTLEKIRKLPGVIHTTTLPSCEI